MNLEEKEISYTTTNSYATLNSLTNKTKNVWFVCHGMGYLSRYFLRYFEGLNKDENYVIAPQAQSKYYSTPKFKHVGASWLTKENTATETENVMRNFDAILTAETLPKNINLIVLGYSQGVSVATRYVAKRKLPCAQLVLHSGSIPKELEIEDFTFLKAKVTMIYGTEDEYLNQERITYETNKAKELFGSNLHIVPFNGKHVVNVELIKKLV
ncbi:dienelactone hydrolase family protein [Oceanihabitans sp. 2_MG-2023]|uniref:alpha/beta hydrolase n=1 Tax=Oceanihabitans sp. 2_MG-2023 TaxID=3062661 RepID=UPI0026E1CA5D|nr:dienelactone hydrolase family protein [Oceanihabitans sp. 2_MG-2023]MDO6597343.1 dienelactone hydrolase family protein [Oceanihabitans sp. 2_MG-2023]